MAAAMRGIYVGLGPDQMVVFNGEGDDLALFSRPGTSFPRGVLETIASGGVIASLGASTPTNIRRLRLQSAGGEVILDQQIFVYLT